MQAIADGWNADHRRGRQGQAARGLRRQPWRPAIDRIELEPGGPVPHGPALRAAPRAGRSTSLGAWRSDGAARWVFIWPTVIVILFLSIFPLVASLALSFSSSSSRRAASTSLRRLHELPAAAVRHRAEPFPRRAQAADAARLGDPRAGIGADRLGVRPQPSVSGSVAPARARPPAHRPASCFVGLLWLVVGTLPATAAGRAR